MCCIICVLCIRATSLKTAVVSKCVKWWGWIESVCACKGGKFSLIGFVSYESVFSRLFNQYAYIYCSLVNRIRHVWHKRLSVAIIASKMIYSFMKSSQWLWRKTADKCINRTAGTLGLFGWNFCLLNNARNRTWSHFLKTFNYSDWVASLRFKPEFEIKVY